MIARRESEKRNDWATTISTHIGLHSIHVIHTMTATCEGFITLIIVFSIDLSVKFVIQS